METRIKHQYRARDKEGRFDYTNLDLICRCGHELGIHAAENESKTRPCFNEDKYIDGATGEYCPCKNFRKSLS